MILYFINSALPYGVKNKVLDDVTTGSCRKTLHFIPSFLYCNYIVVGFLGIYVVFSWEQIYSTLWCNTHLYYISQCDSCDTGYDWCWELWALFKRHTYWIQRQMVQQRTRYILLAIVDDEAKYWLCKFDEFCHCRYEMIHVKSAAVLFVVLKTSHGFPQEFQMN